jgi:uncharacterized membrane protein
MCFFFFVVCFSAIEASVQKIMVVMVLSLSLIQAVVLFFACRLVHRHPGLLNRTLFPRQEPAANKYSGRPVKLEQIGGPVSVDDEVMLLALGIQGCEACRSFEDSAPSVLK